MTRKRRARLQREVSPVLAKITQPALGDIYARNRLFRQLDQARGKHSIVWIAGPAGAGKTTLVASYVEARCERSLWYQVDAADNDVASFFYYLGLAVREAAPRFRRPMPLLTREYFAGLSAFAINYFRELFARLRPPAVVVLDDYHALAADGPLHEVLQQGFAEIPPGTNVIVISREPPPPAFARSRASDKIALLGWEDIKFTETESAGIVKLRMRTRPLTREARERLYQQTQGWVAGLVLLVEQAARNMSALLHSGQFAGEEVFDYFASEIFRHTEPNVQAFLLKTAFLPKIALPAAQALTNEPDAEAILKYLTRRNLFTVRHADGSYEYHPLFRGFLASRAAVLYPPEQLQVIKRESARVLAESGDIESAVALLLPSPSEPATALMLILRHANTLVSTGRTHTLQNWLSSIPEPLRMADPWVLYWLGACRLAFAPAEARTYFEQAFALFEKQDDAAPLYLTWSGLIESFVFERDDFTPMRPWLERYRCLAAGRTPPGREIETSSLITYVLGLISTAFDHPDLPVEAKCVAQRLGRESHTERWLAGLTTLIPYYAWRGELSEMRHALARLATHTRSPEARPLAQLSWHTWKCLHDGATGAVEASLQAVQEGLALANRTGIHIFDTQLLGYGIWGQLCAGHVAGARELLQRLQPLVGERRVGEAYFNHFASLVSLAEGDIAGAVAQGRRAAEQAHESGLSLGEMTYSLGLASVLAAKGALDEAEEVLAESRCQATAMGSKLYIAYSALTGAYVHRARGRHSSMLASLTEALELIREIGVVFPAYLPRHDNASLCALALEHGIEVDYVRSAIAKMRLSPPPDNYSEHWPWPVHIYTLGRFKVVKDGGAIAFGARSGRKPVELLRALVAFGGRDVSFTRLAQTLWPEADGDLARRNMETTLHRLRRLIGDQTILRQENQLSLNERHCWLDVWAFERLAERDAQPTSVASHAKRLLELYHGRFLAEDDSAPAMILRERLRAKFIRAMADLCSRLEAENNYETAVLCYDKAVDAEPLAEELYRRLMSCNFHLRRPAQALAAYRRCRTALQSMLSIDPSEETESLYREIKRCT